ncbi:16S rRNA (cytosine(1402)-N(4))-methyltransferase, partial [bacterium]|nr:16S rRNA (cytosine(1402)-N(4))-methyltransferase [bacterium]
GIDQDPNAREAVKKRLGDSAMVLSGNFSQATILLKEYGVPHVDRILADLGISSYQLDASERGFSFSKDEPLDLRMNPESGVPAHQWLAKAGEKELSDAFYYFGELVHNARLVKEIIHARRRGGIKTTKDLVDLVKKSYTFGSRPMMMKILSQVFQGIRIAVNEEFDVLTRFLEQTPTLLLPGGRIGIITFHSGEDRLVKRFYQGRKDEFKAITKHVVTASDEEIRRNLRSKPAKLRVYERI